MVYRFFRLLPLYAVLALLAAGGYCVKTRFLDPPNRPLTYSAPYSDEGILGGNSGLTATPGNPGDTPSSQTTAARLAEPDRRVVDQPNFALEDYANARARHDALVRIDAIPHLSDAQRAQLVSAANRARGLGCIFIVPFDPGKQTLGTRETEGLVGGFKAGGVRRLLGDPTLVFAVLGYADTPTDEKTALARAQNVLAVMRGRCGVRNTAYAVGMAGPSPFNAKSPTGKAPVEIWAVYP